MASEATLKATLREETGKGAMRKLRASGRIPAVVYGHNEETRALSVDAHELEVLFSRISVENTIIRLDIQGEKKKGEVDALVREVQAHPWKARVLHVDFYQVHAGEKVDVDVPIRLTGTAAGVKAGGVMDHVVHDLPIRCLPSEIMESIEVDVSELEIGDSVHVRDLRLPGTIEIEMDADRTICSVVTPAILEVEEPEDEEALEGLEPELIGEGEEEGEAAEGEAEGDEGEKEEA